MTVWLSSCGQVATDQCGEQVPDRVLRAANIYQALVTWLLSLVSTCSDSTQEKIYMTKAVICPPSNSYELTHTQTNTQSSG